MSKGVHKPGQLVMVIDPKNRTVLVHGSIGMVLNKVTRSYATNILQYNVLINEEIFIIHNECIHNEWLRKYPYPS